MKKIIVALLSCLLHLCCSAQSFDQLDIRFFNDQQGLSYNDTRCFYRDKKGFLWIGTTDGLNRYDGNSIKVYYQKHGDKNSLPGNSIISIIGDDSAGLWILTSEGVVHFFPDDETAIDYTIALDEGKNQSIAGTLGKLFYDASHTLCLINDYGISFFDKKKNIFILHRIKHPLDSNQITRITEYQKEDKNTLLLLGYDGVISYNTITNQYHYIKATLDYFRKFPSFPLISFIKNDDGKFWITTSCYGLIIIDEKNNSAQSFLIDSNITNRNLQNLLSFIVKPVSGVFKNKILIGTQGYGVFAVKPEEQNNFRGFDKIDNSKKVTEEQLEKKLTAAHCFYTDPQNSITYIGNDYGVFTINPVNQVFRKYENLFPGWVTGILKKETPLKESRYYFSSVYNGGFHLFDKSLNKIKSYSHVPPLDTSPGSSFINSLYTDRKNELWIATGNGLYLYDEVNDKFKGFLPDSTNANSIRYHRITTLIQDHRGIYWIGFFVKGFQCYDAEKQIFYDLPLPTPANKTYVFNIIEDADNNIWLGLNNGIVKINEARNKFIEYFADKNDPNGLSHSEAECFLSDRKGRLWIGTYNGLNLYLPQTNTFKKYFRENGLHSDNILAMAEDSKGNILIGSDNALNVLNPETGKINFYKGIGAAYIYCDKDGKVILGGGGGSTTFMTCDETAIKKDIVFPVPYISDLKITGEDKSNRNVATLNMSTIKLSYNENYLTFDFTGVSYNEANLNQFKCKLQGLETKWNETGKMRSISYAALEPGDYDFKLMCCNGDGIWNPKIASLHISIRPPWWQTWWFRLFLILLFASCAYYVYLRRIKAVRAEENIKTKLAQLETQALMAQMNPHFIFNALNSIQACIVSNNNDAAYKYLNKFSILVRSILQNSLEAFILLSNELDVLKNYLELEQLRFKDLDFKINLSWDINSNDFKVPSSFMQPFVENAIIHGLAHKAGEKILEIEILKTGDNLIFKIKDNGIGRKKSAEINLKRTRSHTSLGMSIVESRLKLINEQYHSQTEIKINDLIDADENALGTEVILILPMAVQEELY